MSAEAYSKVSSKDVSIGSIYIYVKVVFIPPKQYKHDKKGSCKTSFQVMMNQAKLDEQDTIHLPYIQQIYGSLLMCFTSALFLYFIYRPQGRM